MRLLAAVLCAAILAGCRIEGDADFSGALQTEILPAESYQQEIAAIDRLLFRTAPLGEDGVRELKKVINGLAERVVKAKANSKFLKLESLELHLLAERAGDLPKDGTGRLLQNDWMRIRNNLFDDRAWFVRSAADLEYAAQADPPPAPVPEPAPAPARIARPQAFASPLTVRRDTLSGPWQVTSILANGVPREDDEISGSTWTFDPPRLIVRDGKGRETVYNCVEEDGYLAVTTPNGEEGWMKYEMRGEALWIAFYDGLKGKPASFDADLARNDPLLVVVRLVALRQS